MKKKKITSDDPYQHGLHTQRGTHFSAIRLGEVGCH